MTTKKDLEARIKELETQIKENAEKQKYNGWSNYETWAVKLWIDNEQGSYNYWLEAAQEVWNESGSGRYEWQTREQQFAYNLSKRLKDEHEEKAEEMTGEASMFSDLMSAALGSVNWYEIAEHYVDEIDKSNEEDEEEEEQPEATA